MTTATDQFIDIAKRSQGAVTTAVRSWADTAQSLIGNLTEGQAKLLDAQAYVDTYFDVAAKVLTSQREGTFCIKNSILYSESDAI